MEPVDFNAVELRGVGRLFGPVRALAGVDFRLGSGDACLLVGPNGAGKSTFLRILSTLLRPTAGEILFDGRAPAEAGRGLRGRIAFLSHRTQLHGELTGRECLALGLDLQGNGGAADAVDAWISRFGLAGFVDRPVRTYSRGQAQRVALSRALLGGPRLVLLDEPATGLDGESVAVLRSVLDEERARGTMLVVSTHDPAALDGVVTRRVELRNGRLVADAPAAAQGAVS